MSKSTTARLSELPLKEIAEIVDSLYDAFDDIQGYITDGETNEAKDLALKMMMYMEDDVV